MTDDFNTIICYLELRIELLETKCELARFRNEDPTRLEYQLKESNYILRGLKRMRRKDK